MGVDDSAGTQTVCLREGALAEIGDILATLDARRVFLVVDQRAYDASGAASVLQPALHGLEVTRFDGFEPNPKLTDVVRGVNRFREASPEIVIALGGGTAIDLGKLIAAFSCQECDLRELAVGATPIHQNGPPLIAAPTTSGTGSEATHFAVVYVDGVKYSVAHSSLLPQFAIVDPQLTYSLPSIITAATGLDAFCQAIESIWAVGATDESTAFATEAATLAIEHLESVTHNPTPSSRIGMCRASHLAGKAINISKTTLPHAISYAITSSYGVPHGAAVAATLGAVLVYNSEVADADCNDPRGMQHVRDRIALILQLLGAPNVNAARAKIEQLVTGLGCPSSIAEVGVRSAAEARQIVKQVNAERLSNNPRQASQESLVQMLTVGIDSSLTRKHSP